MYSMFSLFLGFVPKTVYHVDLQTTVTDETTSDIPSVKLYLECFEGVLDSRVRISKLREAIYIFHY